MINSLGYLSSKWTHTLAQNAFDNPPCHQTRMPTNRCNQARNFGITETHNSTRREIQQQKTKSAAPTLFRHLNFFFRLLHCIESCTVRVLSLSSHAPWTRLITTFDVCLCRPKKAPHSFFSPLNDTHEFLLYYLR